MSIKKPFLIILFFLFGFSASALASIGNTVSTLPLTHEEEETLLFMREEEKLARDVYLTLYEFWESHDGSSIFKNIESCYWLELLAEAHIFTPEKLMPLMTEADELMAILTTCVKKVKAEGKKVKDEGRRLKDERSAQ